MNIKLKSKMKANDRSIAQNKKSQLLFKFMNILLFSLLLGVQSYSQTIIYSIENAQITNDGTNSFYEADIAITTDTDFALGLSQFYLDYNTAAFGTNIFGGNLTFAHPTGTADNYVLNNRLFGDTQNAYTPILANNQSAKLSIAWNPLFQGAIASTGSNVTVANNPNLIAHIKIQYIVDPNTVDPMVGFDDENPPIPSSQGLSHVDASPIPIQITMDTYDSSGAIPSIVWDGETDNDWNTAANWGSNSVPIASQNVIIPASVNVTRASGDINFNNLTIASGSSLTVSSGNVNNNSGTGTITVNSGASLIAPNSTAFNLTYNRNLASSNWYLLAAPVSGQDIDAFASAESLEIGTGNNRGLGFYNNTTGTWDYYQNGVSGSGAFTTGSGAAINLQASDNLLVFTGGMNLSDVSVAIAKGTANGFNLLGNTYPSFISANIGGGAGTNILAANSSILQQQTLWFWDQSENSGAGAYEAVNYATSDFYISPGQGFFVESNVTGGNFSITEAMQSHQSTDSFQRSFSSRPEILLTLTDGALTRNVDIFYIHGTTTGWDSGYDSTIFDGAANDFDIYTHLVSGSSGQDLEIQSLPDSGYESMIIPVGVNATSGTTITVSAISVNLPTGLNIYLEDKNDNSFTLLDSSSDFTTTLSEDLNGIGRFYIHTTSSSTLNTEEINLDNISIYTSNKDNLRIVGIQNGTASIDMYNILGKRVLNASFQGNRVNNVQLSNLRAGVYIIHLQTQNGKLNKKIIIE